MPQAVLLSGLYCADAQIVTIPGDPGPEGPKGDKGDKGDPGQDGINGTNGISAQLLSSGVLPAAPPDPNQPAIWYPTSGFSGVLTLWDLPSQSWIPFVGGSLVGSGPPVAAGQIGQHYWDQIGKFDYVYDSDGWNIH